jgi:peptidoglycan/xylan/chitin deacetylase (PgdA/CDA1 family)
MTMRFRYPGNVVAEMLSSRGTRQFAVAFDDGDYLGNIPRLYKL